MMLVIKYLKHLKIKLYLENYEINLMRVKLVRVTVFLKFLTSIREYHGINSLASSTETLSSTFDERLASMIVESVRNSHWKIYHLISKIEKVQEKHS
jgi:hypothetical protein